MRIVGLPSIRRGWRPGLGFCPARRWKQNNPPVASFRDRSEGRRQFADVSYDFSRGEAIQLTSTLLMTVPVIVIFFFAQKYFIQGVTLTGMKGWGRNSGIAQCLSSVDNR